jgi:hypothetical protein
MPMIPFDSAGVYRMLAADGGVQVKMRTAVDCGRGDADDLSDPDREDRHSHRKQFKGGHCERGTD